MTSPATAAAPLRCTDCAHQPLTTFWEVDGRVLCPACHDRLAAPPSRPARRRRRIRAALWGSAAAMAGFLLYAGAAEIVGGELPLLALVVGLGVGRAVRAGAGEHTGRTEKSIAAVLTYCAIVAASLPPLLPEIAATVVERSTWLERWIVSGAWGALVLATPFLGGFENLLGMALLTLSLVLAWRSATSRAADLRGPFRIET